ncbi:MAG: hypothetical protein ACREBC_00470, partial [Pyrinomonadaceae bacterium]
VESPSATYLIGPEDKLTVTEGATLTGSFSGEVGPDRLQLTTKSASASGRQTPFLYFVRVASATIYLIVSLRNTNATHQSVEARV